MQSNLILQMIFKIGRGRTCGLVIENTIGAGMGNPSSKPEPGPK